MSPQHCAIRADSASLAFLSSPARPYRLMPPTQRYLTSRNSSMPYFEPSRPMPVSFMPPNGAISVEMMPPLMPTMPYPRPSATR
jgi:hypothetical protein